ncbi:phage tail tape measure protein [Aeromonas veronii]|uniref:phage tail tape measure protein n=1 Tax=Aeromonas veronii TaxID=654 RepID=UPI0018F21A0E|nr:phage tail tape measure protein [Aeromonas veronii]MBJ7582976.1 phage tail tape measure protein [Aeromonas veronii]
MANKKLSATITIGGAVASSLKSAFGSVKGGVNEVGSALRAAEKQQRLLTKAINREGWSGIGNLDKKLKAATERVDKLRASFKRLRDVQSRQNANLDARSEYRGQVVDAVALGATVAAPVVMAAKFETAMLGVAKQVDGARDSGGKLTSVYYDMQKQIQKLGREIPIATNEIADMVTAGARMGVAKDELIGFTRTTAMMATAFELPAGELADSMGKIAGLFKIPIPAIGELADAINYLDDNAISKGGDIIDFMTRTGGVAGSIKITAKEMAALGSTLLTLGDRSETASTATNAMFQKFAAASKGSKKFKAALKEVGLSAEEVQKGMQIDATGTMLKVLEAIRKLPSDARSGVMTELVGLEHSDTLAKLVSGIEEYKKQLALANGEAAKGSMSREYYAMLETTTAQWTLMKNIVSEVAVNFGSVLLPVINDTFKAITPTVVAIADFARENPAVTKAIVGTAVALVGLKISTMAIGYAFTFFKGGVLSVIGLFYRMEAGAALGAGKVTLLGKAFAAVGRGVMWLGKALGTGVVTGIKALGKAFMFVGRSIIWIGRALVMNPIGMIITAIGLLGYWIYENWDWIGPWFGKLWDGIVEKFDYAAGKIKSLIDDIKQRWESFKNLVSGGVGSVWNSTVSTVTETGNKLGGVFQDAFKWAGFGDDKEENSTPPVPAPEQSLPQLPPIRTNSGGKGGQYYDHSQVTIQIAQRKGESDQAFAKRLAAELESLRGVRQRSMMTEGMIPQ